MKKKYESPEIETINVRVEKGFATSGGGRIDAGPVDTGGIGIMDANDGGSAF